MTAECELPDWVQPGRAFRVTIGAGGKHLWHIRAVVDDRAVCRRWKNFQWEYKVLEPEFFDVYREHIAFEEHDAARLRSGSKAARG